jgi:uridine nucleosidase
MPEKILIDTDPGVDDAMAILFALRSPELEVVGLTTIFGNADLEITTRNAIMLLELEGNAHVPVARGCSRPLVKPSAGMGTFVHGDDGMGNTNLPPPKGKPIGIPAAQFIVETVLDNPGEITLVPIGPLTNIALAIRLEPKIVSMIRRVVIMGGSVAAGGNITPVAEANIYHDPHAASVVFEAGWPLTMVGLDVTQKVVMTKEYLEELNQKNNPATDLIGRILPVYQQFHKTFYGLDGDIHTHDPSAIAYLISPELFKIETYPVFVETEGRCAGHTVPDTKSQWGERALVDVCMKADEVPFLDLYMERLGMCHSEFDGQKN